jgi:hypothetical protein
MSDSNVLHLIYKVSYLFQQNWIETHALLKIKINEILSKKTNPVEKDACFEKWKVSGFFFKVKETKHYQVPRTTGYSLVHYSPSSQLGAPIL